MTYLSKSTILAAYKKLSLLSPNPNMQGATQKVSAIRYFVALDQFYKSNSRECDIKSESDKKEFVDFIGNVCDVCQNLYTPNFYVPLKKHQGDYNTGSNFFSAGQMLVSQNSPSRLIDYPKRGSAPLFQIKDNVLLRIINYYNNFNTYISGVDSIAAFIIWLLRKTDIVLGIKSGYEQLKDLMRNTYTQEFVSVLFANQEGVQAELDKYPLTFTDSVQQISENDIDSLFSLVHVKQSTSPVVAKTDSKCQDVLSYLTALRTKPFMLLAGISGTGKSRIVRKLAQATVTENLQKQHDKEYTGTDFKNDRWNLHAPSNFQIIQVKPNWHNSMDVLGYLSNIPSPHYVLTPFVNFIVKAWMTPDVPFFLCLDEMNLAPVEEYFAEFLSAIESRDFEKGEYITDPIIKPFDEFGDGIAVSMIDELNKAIRMPMNKSLEGHLRKKGLTLPQNLMVIGTVNMDETTFSFSRKVLDRAMSIEMNEVDYESYLGGNTDDGIKAIVSAFDNNEYKDSNGNGISLNDLLVNRHIAATEVIPFLGGTETGSDARFVIDYLNDINKLLDGTPFKLGYRAANEALIHLRSAQEFGIGDNASAMDNFTLMKILSRIEGDETKLKITGSESDCKKLTDSGVDAKEAEKHGNLTILTALREITKEHLGEFSIGEEQPTENESTEADGETPTNTPETASETVMQPHGELRKSIKKIDDMISQLERDHFVSYWN